MVWGKTEIFVVVLIVAAVVGWLLLVRCERQQSLEATPTPVVRTPVYRTIEPRMRVTATAAQAARATASAAADSTAQPATPVRSAPQRANTLPSGLQRDIQTVEWRMEAFLPTFTSCVRGGRIDADRYREWFRLHAVVSADITRDSLDGQLNDYTVQELRNYVANTHAKLDEIEAQCNR